MGLEPHDPLLAKPDRPRSLPAKAENGTGRGRFGIVPGCPLETGQDCCEWHASGTATRTTFVGPGSVGTSSTVGGRPDAGNAWLVGKGRRPAAAVRGALAAIVLHWTPGSLVRRGMPRTARRSEPSGGDHQLPGEGKALQGASCFLGKCAPVSGSILIGLLLGLLSGGLECHHLHQPGAALIGGGTVRTRGRDASVFDNVGIGVGDDAFGEAGAGRGKATAGHACTDD
jgi:hypothetical protein